MSCASAGELLRCEQPELPPSGGDSQHALTGPFHVGFERDQGVEGAAVQDQQVGAKTVCQRHGPWHVATEVFGRGKTPPADTVSTAMSIEPVGNCQKSGISQGCG